MASISNAPELPMFRLGVAIGSGMDRNPGAENLSREAEVRKAEGPLEQFQEKCETVFRPELRKNKDMERFGVSVKR